VGRYHSGDEYTSKTGVLPKVSMTRATARESIHALGDDVWQSDFAMRFTIWLLYLVEFADWNSQAKIGYGCGRGNDIGMEAMGASDEMPYHTGTMQTSLTTYGVGVQYRYIEDLWGNAYEWEDGCYNNSNGLNIILDPNNFSDDSGGTFVFGGLPANSAFPSAFSVSAAGGFPMFYPTEYNGTNETYMSDSWSSFDASTQCVDVGGSYARSRGSGLFCTYSCKKTTTYTNVGCRLMVLPDPAA
jgi:hypothetical protein